MPRLERLKSGDYIIYDGDMKFEMSPARLARHCEWTIQCVPEDDDITLKNALKALIFHLHAKILQEHCKFEFAPGILE